MYLTLILILVCLIVRVYAIEWRKTINIDAWRNGRDTVHTVSVWITPLLWSVALASLVQGMHIEVGHYNDDAFVPVASQDTADSLADNYHYLTGGFFLPITPFTAFGGTVIVSLFLSHGTIFLALETTDDLGKRARVFTKKSILVPTSAMAAWALWA